MRKRVLFLIISVIAVFIALVAMYNINYDNEKTPDIPDSASATPAPQTIIEQGYEIRLSGETLYMSIMDESGSELSREALNYIDVHSLQSFQLESLRLGAKFKTRQAAAEFIQDLDS